MVRLLSRILSAFMVVSLLTDPLKACGADSPNHLSFGSRGQTALFDFQAMQAPLPAAFPVPGHAGLMRAEASMTGVGTYRDPEVTRKEIGNRIVRGGPDWSLIFLDLDDMRHFNVELDKPVVDAHYRERMIHILDKDPRFKDLSKGFSGGDEIFIFIPGSPSEARARMDALRQIFRNGGVNPDRRMTASMGILHRDQVPSKSGLFEIPDPKARYLAARELVSRGLQIAKDELGKDGIAPYSPPNLRERLWVRVNAWYFDHFLPLNLAAYQTKIVNKLFRQNDNDARMEADYIDESIDQFHSIKDFRDDLSATLAQLPRGAPVLLGSTQALYSGPLLEKATEILRSKGREVHGAWAGGKVWNIWDPTYTAFDHIILAIRLVVVQQLALCRTDLPMSWRKAELRLVRGPPDSLFFALVPDLPAIPLSEARYAILLEEAEQAKLVLQTAIQKAQDILSPSGSQFKMAHRNVEVSMQAVAKILVARGAGQPNPLKDPGIQNPFRQMEILHTWLADGRSGIAEHDGAKPPPVRMEMLAAESAPDPEYIAKAEQIQTDRVKASGEFLDDREINREAVFILPVELQAAARHEVFLPIDSQIGQRVGEALEILVQTSPDHRELADLHATHSIYFRRYGLSGELLALDYVIKAHDRIEILVKLNSVLPLETYTSSRLGSSEGRSDPGKGGNFTVFFRFAEIGVLPRPLIAPWTHVRPSISANGALLWILSENLIYVLSLVLPTSVLLLQIGYDFFADYRLPRTLKTPWFGGRRNTKASA